MDTRVGKVLALTMGVFWAVLVWRADAQSAPPQTRPSQPQETGRPDPIEAGETAASANVLKLFKQASDLIENDRSSDAIPLLRRAIQLAPNEGRIHHYLGYALMRTSQFEAAQKEYEIALRLEPGNVYSEYFLAQTHDTLGQRDQALALYEKILASGNVIYDTYQRLGRAYARKRQFEKALEMTQQALQQSPWDGALHYQLATIYRQMGRTSEAEREFATGERLKRIDQSSIQKVLQLSEAVRQNDMQQVGTLRAELLEQSGKDPELMTWLGVTLGQGGHYEDALVPLQKAAAAGPCSYETCYNLGLTLVRLGKNQEAEEFLKKALALRPDSFETNLVLAVAYVNLGRNREAIERLRTAQEAQPNNVRILLLLGQQYLMGWYVQQAIGTLREVLNLDPLNLEGRYLLITAYQNDKAYDKALEVARETVKLHPGAGRAHYEIGHQLANLGHYQEGRPYFEKALELDSSLVEAHVWLGDVNSRSGQYEAALQNYQRAKELDPRNLDAVRGFTLCLTRLERYPQALTELQKSIADYPGDAQLYLQLSQVYGRLGNLQEAERARSTFQKLHAQELKERANQRPQTFSP